MTNPDHEDRTDTEPADGIASLVRATLTAVAEQTDIAAGPSEDRAGNDEPTIADLGPGGSDGRTGTVLLPMPEPVPEDGAEHRSGDRRRWAVVAAAAALVAVLVGVLGVAVDQGAVTTGLGGPGAPAPTGGGPPLIVGVPRSVLGLELVDVQTSTWFGPNTPGSIPPSSVPEPSPAPLAGRMAHEAVYPLAETGTQGATIWYSFDTPGRVLTVGDTIPIRVIVRMGVTVDPAALATMGGVPSDAIDGLLVGPPTEACGLATSAVWPPSPDATTLTPAPGTESFSDPSACRTIQLAWTDDVLIIVDAEPGLVLDDVIAGLRAEELDDLEARLAGISDTGRVRRSLEEAMPWMLPAAERPPIDATSGTVPGTAPGPASPPVVVRIGPDGPESTTVTAPGG